MICQAGKSGGFATGRGTTPCGFRATWNISNRYSTSYAACGIHKNAAVREQPDRWIVEARDDRA